LRQAYLRIDRREHARPSRLSTSTIGDLNERRNALASRGGGPQVAWEIEDRRSRGLEHGDRPGKPGKSRRVTDPPGCRLGHQPRHGDMEAQIMDRRRPATFTAYLNSKVSSLKRHESSLGWGSWMRPARRFKR